MTATSTKATLTLTPVQSSNLAAIGFDGQEIHVRFKGGRVCAYGYEIKDKQGLADLFEDFAAAESKGKFFAQRIRDRFQYRSYVEKDDDAVPVG